MAQTIATSAASAWARSRPAIDGPRVPDNTVWYVSWYRTTTSPSAVTSAIPTCAVTRNGSSG